MSQQNNITKGLCMQEQDQYTNVCKEQFDRIVAAIQDLDNRLFRDNGCKSIQTKINQVEAWQANHDEHKTQKCTFWYWLIPVLVSIGIVIVDKMFK